jgi:hypothetical protein
MDSAAMTQHSPGTGIFRMWAKVSSPDEVARAIILWAMRLGAHRGWFLIEWLSLTAKSVYPTCGTLSDAELWLATLSATAFGATRKEFRFRKQEE